MNVTGISNNLFANNYTQTTKVNAKSAFLAALEEKLTSKSAEAQRAEDMTKALEDLDKALEKAAEDKPVEISETLLDWLKNRHDSGDISVQRNVVERTVHADGSVAEVSMGGFVFSDGYINLINDLFELGILSARDIEVLNGNDLIPLPTDNIGQIMRTEDLPFRQRFFNETLNPNWNRDLSGYHKAMSETYLDAFISGFNGINGNNWYEEAAEVHNRLADILSQIF
jgi:hypothetical protein